MVMCISDGPTLEIQTGNTLEISGETHSGDVQGQEVTVVLDTQGQAQLNTSWTNHFPRLEAGQSCLHIGGAVPGTEDEWQASRDEVRQVAPGRAEAS